MLLKNGVLLAGADLYTDVSMLPIAGGKQTGQGNMSPLNPQSPISNLQSAVPSPLAKTAILWYAIESGGAEAPNPRLQRIELAKYR